MEEKKSKSGIVIGILVVLVLALGGYLVYDKVIKKEEKKEEKTEKVEKKRVETKEELNLDEFVKRFALNKVGFANPWLSTKNYKIGQMEDKDYVGLTSMINYEYFKSNSEEDKTRTDSTVLKTTKQVYETAFKNVFGPDVSIKNISYSNKLEDGIGCMWYLYDNSTDSYKAYAECGGVAFTTIQAYEIKSDGKYATLNSKIIKPEYSPNDSGKNYVIKIGSNKVELRYENITFDTKEFVDKYKDYLNTYQFKFKKASDGKYYFYSTQLLNDAKEYNE